MNTQKKKKEMADTSRGQSLVEFAISLPVLLLMCVLCMDIANFIYATSRVTAATREGAKLATEASDAPGSELVRQAAITRTQRSLTDSGIPWWDPKVRVDAQWISAVSGNTSYSLLKVEASYTPRLFFGGLLALGRPNASLTVSGSSVGYANFTLLNGPNP